jgi:hypothetical protein
MGLSDARDKKLDDASVEVMEASGSASVTTGAEDNTMSEDIDEISMSSSEVLELRRNVELPLDVAYTVMVVVSVS